LPRAGTRSGPLSRHCGVPGKNGWPVLGLLRSPAQGKPAHYRAAAHTLIVVSWLAPRWDAKRPSLQTLRCARQNGWPVLGLLRSPAQGKPAHYRAAAHTLIVVSGLAPRWTRSCPLSRHCGVPGKNGWPVLGLLRRPAQGKPAHYRAAAHTLIVVSGLVPRWGAKRPQT